MNIKDLIDGILSLKRECGHNCMDCKYSRYDLYGNNKCLLQDSIDIMYDIYTNDK